MHWMYPMGGGWVMMIIWWVVIIAVVAVVVKLLTPQKWQLPKEDTAIELLKKRYARGEISKDEFEEKKKDLI